MGIDELAKEYDKQYKVLCAKVDGLKPLLSVYRGEDLFKLRRKMRIYYDMACECRKVYFMLTDYYREEEI
jgi:hypothetical protein